MQAKKDNPKDMNMEEALTIFRTLKPRSSYQSFTSYILGIFHKNFARLETTIHVTSSHKTKPIKEPILRSIYLDSELTQTHRDAIDLMNYGAERIHAFTDLPLENVRLIEGSNLVILDIPASLAKTGLAHPSIIPKELAERRLEAAQQNGYETLLPNMVTLFKQVTALAARKYQIRLTSHYFRKRFESIAETITSDDMNPNHWLTLMGSKPTLGHMPEIYSLNFEEELLQEYGTHLQPRLTLTGEAAQRQQSLVKQLLKENQELKEQLLKLTKLLTKQLGEQTT